MWMFSSDTSPMLIGCNSANWQLFAMPWNRSRLARAFCGISRQQAAETGPNKWTPQVLPLLAESVWISCSKGMPRKDRPHGEKKFDHLKLCWRQVSKTNIHWKHFKVKPLQNDRDMIRQPNWKEQSPHSIRPKPKKNLQNTLVRDCCLQNLAQHQPMAGKTHSKPIVWSLINLQFYYSKNLKNIQKYVWTFLVISCSHCETKIKFIWCHLHCEVCGPKLSCKAQLRCESWRHVVTMAHPCFQEEHPGQQYPQGSPLKFVVLFRFGWFRNIYAKEGSYLKHHPLCKIKRKFSKHIFSTNLGLSTSLYKNPCSWPTMIRKCWSYKQDSTLLIRNHGFESMACALSDIGLSLAKTAGGRP